MKVLIKSTILLICFFASISLFPLSLWDDEFKDIYSKKVKYEAGDSVNIVFSENTLIKYKSQSTTFKSNEQSFKSEDLSGVFDLIPKGSGTTSRNSQENDALSINLSIQGEITKKEGSKLTIYAYKSLTVNNKINIIEVQGIASISDIKAGSIKTTFLREGRLRITTLSESDKTIIGPDDITPDIAAADATGDANQTINLTDQKKRLLLIEFLNKALNIIY